jgi:hypothetical protein
MVKRSLLRPELDDRISYDYRWNILDLMLLYDPVSFFTGKDDLSKGALFIISQNLSQRPFCSSALAATGRGDYSYLAVSPCSSRQ